MLRQSALRSGARGLSLFATLLVGATFIPQPASGGATAADPSSFLHEGSQDVRRNAGGVDDTTVAFGSVGASGAYRAQLPLEFPEPRGDLSLPLSIDYQSGSRVGEAGVGWSVNTWRLRISRSVSGRKPKDGTRSVPERVQLFRGAEQTVMTPTENPHEYRAAVESKYLRLTGPTIYDGERVFLLHDAQGRTYVFKVFRSTQVDQLLFLTEVIDRTGINRVRFHYDVDRHTYCAQGVPRHSDVLLKAVSYGYDTEGVCPKFVVRLNYRPWTWRGTPGPTCAAREGPPQAILAEDARSGFLRSRMRLLDSVSVHAALPDACLPARGPDVTVPEVHETTRRAYRLTYEADADTGLPRVTAVDEFGRGGTGLNAVGGKPVAQYRYGAATSTEGALRFLHGTEVDLPPGTVGLGLSRGVLGGEPGEYVTDELVQDINGDGLTDIIFRSEQTGAWFIYTNQTGPTGSDLGVLENAFALPSVDEINRQRATGLSTTFQSRYFVYLSQWTGLFDVNGDGRLDRLRAHEDDPTQWNVYLNTPHPAAGGQLIRWRHRALDMSGIYTELQDRGLIDGDTEGLFPLSRSATDQAESYRRIRTEWKLLDVNGDGYLDFVFNSSRLQPDVVEDCTIVVGTYGTDAAGDVELVGTEIVEQCDAPVRFQYAEDNHLRVYFNTSLGGRLSFADQSVPLLGTGRDVCGVEGWFEGGRNDDWGGERLQECGFADINGDGFVDYLHGGDYAFGDQVHPAIWLNSGHPSGFDESNDFRLPGPPVRVLSERPRPCERTYTSRQLAGLHDLTGDGIPDYVRLNRNALPEPQWEVQVGMGRGFTRRRPILSKASFEMDLSEQYCDGGASSTIQALIDINGDRRPEVVRRADENAPRKWEVQHIVGRDARTHAHNAGRLVQVGNGYGGRMFIEYGSAKTDTLTPHQIPFPELVVTRTHHRAVAGLGESLYRKRYAYGHGRLVYDPMMARWSFVGYGRRIKLQGEPTDPPNAVSPGNRFPGKFRMRFDEYTPRRAEGPRVSVFQPQVYEPGGGVLLPPKEDRFASLVNGVALIQEHIDPTTTGSSYAHYALRGRIRDIYRLEGIFDRDPRTLLDLNPRADNRVRSHERRSLVARVMTTASPVTGEESPCYDTSDTLEGYLPDLDPELCLRSGYVYPATETHWQGTKLPPSHRGVERKRHICAVNTFGQPVFEWRQNDAAAGRSDDDLCAIQRFAVEPGEGGEKVLSVPRKIERTECGFSIDEDEDVSARGGEGTAIRLSGSKLIRAVAPPSANHCSAVVPGNPLWAVRYRYDDRPEGEVVHGLKTHAIIERYNPQSTELIDEYLRFRQSHDPFGNVVHKENPRDDGVVRTVARTYDTYGVNALVETETASDVDVELTEQWVYDPVLGVLVEKIDANGVHTTFAYDDYGRPVRKGLRPQTGASSFVQEEKSYYDDPDDPAGRRVETTSYGWNTSAQGTPTGPTVTTVETAYLDDLGRRYRVERDLGADYDDQVLITESVIYDGFGRRTFEAESYVKGTPRSQRYGTTFHYNNSGRVRCKIRGPGPQRITRRTNRDEDIYPTCFDYRFELGDLVRRTYGPNELQTGHAEHGAYDEDRTSATGQLRARLRIKNGQALELVSFSYDRLGRRKSVLRTEQPGLSISDTAEWRFVYDSLGQLIRTEEADLAPHLHEYNRWGQMVRESWSQDENGETVTYAAHKRYNSLAQLTEEFQTRDGEVIADSRVTRLYDAASADTPASSSTFAVGRLTFAADSTMNTHIVYDVYGRRRLVQRVPHGGAGANVDGKGYIERRHYGSQGRLRMVIFNLPSSNAPSGTRHEEQARYVYDSAGYLDRIVHRDDEGDSATLWKAEDRDAFGRARQVSLRNGVGQEWRYRESRRRELLEYELQTEGRTDRIAYLGYDGEDQLIARRHRWEGTALSRTGPHTRTTQYRYDAQERLARATTREDAVIEDFSYRYDALGNRTERIDHLSDGSHHMVYREDDPDRLCDVLPLGEPASAKCRYAHDGLGNITDITLGGIDDTARHFAYDAESRLTEMEAGQHRASLQYDAFGALAEVRHTADGVLQSRFLQLGPLIEVVRNGAGSVRWIERRILGPEREVVAVLRGFGEGQKTLFRHREHGANRFFTDETGTLVQRLDYRPYGEVKTDTGQPGSKDYTGHQWNQGRSFARFGVVRLGERFYDARTGRFLQRDAVVRTDRASLGSPYAFSFNDPVNYQDPDGNEGQRTRAPRQIQFRLKTKDAVHIISTKVPDAGVFYGESIRDWSGLEWGSIVSVTSQGIARRWRQKAEVRFRPVEGAKFTPVGTTTEVPGKPSQVNTTIIVGGIFKNMGIAAHRKFGGTRRILQTYETEGIITVTLPHSNHKIQFGSTDRPVTFYVKRQINERKLDDEYDVGGAIGTTSGADPESPDGVWILGPTLRGEGPRLVNPEEPKH